MRRIEDLENFKEEFDKIIESKKHLKGYIYDSLVYRYQLALYKASLKDAEDIALNKHTSRKEAEAEARKIYNRNLMRFCQILNEGMGPHD